MQMKLNEITVYGSLEGWNHISKVRTLLSFCHVHEMYKTHVIKTTILVAGSGHLKHCK